MLKIILKFGTVGIINTLLDYCVFEILVHVFHIQSPAYIFIASIISTSAGVLNSYIMNKKWTFQDKDDRYFQQFAAFVVVNLFTIILNSSLVVLFGKLLPRMIYLHLAYIPPFDNVWITKLIAILIVMFVNFVAYRSFVFKLK